MGCEEIPVFPGEQGVAAGCPLEDAERSKL